MFRPFFLGHHQDDPISYSRQLYNMQKFKIHNIQYSNEQEILSMKTRSR